MRLSESAFLVGGYGLLGPNRDKVPVGQRPFPQKEVGGDGKPKPNYLYERNAVAKHLDEGGQERDRVAAFLHYGEAREVLFGLHLAVILLIYCRMNVTTIPETVRARGVPDESVDAGRSRQRNYERDGRRLWL